MIIKVAERIKELRELNNMTQVDLAKRLYVTRSSVNAWEMGISIPTTDKIVELTFLFKCTSDYLLGIDERKTIDISDLEPEKQKILCQLNSILHKDNDSF